jgi:hypothetical protein
MKCLCLVFLTALAFRANAGGDYVSGYVTKFSMYAREYSFEFEQAKNEGELMNGCKKFKVRVNYQHVPWYSWMPFVDSSHPTWGNTKEALKYIDKSSNERHIIYFGYIGSGLARTAEPCIFNSKGLKISNGVVISYYDPV